MADNKTNGGYYEAAQEVIKAAFGNLTATNEVAASLGNATPQALTIQSVGIHDNQPGEFSHSVLSRHNQNLDEFGFDLKVPGIKEYNKDELRKAVLEVLKTLLDRKREDGTSLTDAIDFSAKKPLKGREEEIEALKKQITEGLAQAQNVVPPAIANILTNAKVLDAKNHDFSYGSGLSEYDGRIEMNFSISNKDEGEKSNATVVVENITARKDAILAAIKEEVKKNHPSISAQDIDNLDLQIKASGNENWGSNVSVSIGSKIPTPEDPSKPLVGPTTLAGLSQENLHRIVTDSILLAGPGAEQVVNQLAGEKDIHHFLKQYPQIPAFAEAAKNEMLLTYREQEETEDNAKIKPSVHIDTGTRYNKTTQAFESHDIIHVSTQLPKGVTHAQLIAVLAAQAKQVEQQQTTEVETPATPKPAGLVLEQGGAPANAQESEAINSLNRMMQSTPAAGTPEAEIINSINHAVRDSLPNHGEPLVGNSAAPANAQANPSTPAPELSIEQGGQQDSAALGTHTATLQQKAAAARAHIASGGRVA